MKHSLDEWLHTLTSGCSFYRNTGSRPRVLYTSNFPEAVTSVGDYEKQSEVSEMVRVSVYISTQWDVLSTSHTVRVHSHGQSSKVPNGSSWRKEQDKREWAEKIQGSVSPSYTYRWKKKHTEMKFMDRRIHLPWIWQYLIFNTLIMYYKCITNCTWTKLWTNLFVNSG